MDRRILNTLARERKNNEHWPVEGAEVDRLIILKRRQTIWLSLFSFRLKYIDQRLYMKFEEAYR